MDTREWKQSQKIRVDYNHMMQEFIGGRGIRPEELRARGGALVSAGEAVAAKRGEMKWRELPYQDAAGLEAAAKRIRGQFSDFVVLGIGGSALGPMAVQQALCHLRYNELPQDQRGPRIHIEDNIDPERMAALLDVLDVRTTCFNVVTKSGSTSETMAQFLIIADQLKKAGIPLRQNMVATTDEKKGNLIKIAKEEGLETFFIPEGVGGRFSELCPVGLLAAAVAGIDIRLLLEGAADMDRRVSEADPFKNPAFMLGALQVLAMEKGHNISVMMPYADSLKYIADWYAQLWAESLGKRHGFDGREIFAGQTPVKALGVTDQHSQVQLYTEGPFDKVITFLCVEQFRAEQPIPHGYETIPDVAFLCGHSLNELIEAEQVATEYAILRSGHMNNAIILPQVNPYTIGQLLYLLEVQTAYAGELLQLNAFDQPGVEEGKNATYALLGKPGFEAKRAELLSRPKKREAYIL